MAQPNIPAIDNHFQGIQDNLQGIRDEVVLVANMPPVVGYNNMQQQLNANHLQVMAALGQMQGQLGEMQGQLGEMQGQIGGMQGQIGGIQLELQLLPMRLYNSSASDTAPLRYPVGIPPGPPAPLTRRDLLELTIPQCQAVFVLLGLPELPAAATVAQRRQQIAYYLGVPY